MSEVCSKLRIKGVGTGISELEKATGYKLATPVIEYVAAIFRWCRKYFQM